VGKCKELNEGHFHKKMDLVVTRNKFDLNEQIRKGEDKPDDVSAKTWDALVFLQNDPSVQAKPDFMGSITPRRPSKKVSLKKLMMSVVSELVSRSFELYMFMIELLL
jgi:hypothetical protein